MMFRKLLIKLLVTTGLTSDLITGLTTGLTTGTFLGLFFGQGPKDLMTLYCTTLLDYILDNIMGEAHKKNRKKTSQQL